MTYPSHDYSGLEHESSDPFNDWFEDEHSNSNGAVLEDDVDETVEDDTFNDRDLL